GARRWNAAPASALAWRYDVKALTRRAANKAALQQEAGLPVEKRPLLAMVSRLDPQKGFDIAMPAINRWVEGGGQFLLLGSGRPEIERDLLLLELSHPSSASVRLRFDPVYAHRV